MVSGSKTFWLCIIYYFYQTYRVQPNFFNPVQIITHMFVHANFGHLFMNMFGLFLFGRTIEAVLGSKKMFILYLFVSGLGAAGFAISNFCHAIDFQGFM
jgi:membrane associated rhomboid family serine protease